MNNLNSVKVIFGNPIFNYTTSVSTPSEEDARDYFVGTTFNVGVGLSENMQECVDIEFTGETTQGSTNCECIDPTFTLSKGETLRTCTYCHKLIKQ